MCPVPCHHKAAGGQWTCALTDNYMDTMKHHRELEVMLPGSLCLSLLGGEVRVEEGETEKLEMMAGETLEVVCSLEEAWPVTDLSWAVTRGADIVWGELITWSPGPASVSCAPSP